MILKIRSRSPKPNQLPIVVQFYIHANLVNIRLLVHVISCSKGKCHADADADADAYADANGIRTENNMPPLPFGLGK